MKKKALTSFTFRLQLLAFAQDQPYNISSFLSEGTKAPDTHHQGEA